MIADRLGDVTGYALDNLQLRGQLFVGPGDVCYEGMVIGEASRSGDMVVNAVRAKEKTNIRTHSHDEAVKLASPIDHTLEPLNDRLRRRNEHRLARPRMAIAGLWSLRVGLWPHRRCGIAGEVTRAHLGHLPHAQQAGHVLERLHLGVRHLVVGQRRKLHDRRHQLASLPVKKPHILGHDSQRSQILVGRRRDPLPLPRLGFAEDHLMDDLRLAPGIGPRSAVARRRHGLPLEILK